MIRQLTDEDLDAAIRKAQAAGREAERTEPRARSARYNPRTGRIELELRNGCTFAFPVEKTQGLKGAPPKLLNEVEVIGDGYALRWETLDVDYTVPGLLAGRLGTKHWIASVLGASGGRSKSPAKVRASRENGRRGGRPKKSLTSRPKIR
jgi:hypothetical protein